MDKKFSLGVVVCVMISGVVLVGCASARSVAQDVHLIPTPEGAIPMLSCDEPTWIVGEQEVCRFLVTPLPDEKVRVGTIVEFVPTVESQQQRPRYTIREDIPPWQSVTEPGQVIPVKKLFVHNTETGQEIRLGDDAGHTLFQTMTSEYVIWRYQWDGRSETGRKTGLYVYVLKTGEEIVVARQPDADPWYPEIDSQRVLYTDGLNAERGVVKIRVRNLMTGEDLLVGHHVPHMQQFNARPASDYYAISDSQIVWIETEGGWKVCVYDLTTRTTEILDVPNTSSPVNLGISDGIVIWFDKFWRGYDLEQDVLFTIPTVPPGWEDISVQPASPVTVKDNQLYWALEVNDEVYRFTAPIIRN